MPNAKNEHGKLILPMKPFQVRDLVRNTSPCDGGGVVGAVSRFLPFFT